MVPVGEWRRWLTLWSGLWKRQRWNACWLFWQLVGARFTALTHAERQWLRCFFMRCSVYSISHPFTPETMSDCRHRLEPAELYRTDSLMARRNYFCACLKQRVNILMSVTLIDLLLPLCHSGLSSSPLPPRSSSGSLSVSEVAGLLEPQTLQLLKKECGGLQTLLKNNHQVFRGSSEHT